MRRSNKCLLFVLLFGSTLNAVCGPQMAPKVAAIIRNDADADVTIESREAGTWKAVAIHPHQDISVKGDRIRVTSPRDDKAQIIVDLPIEMGTKYHVFWNEAKSMWDFSVVK